MDAKNDAVVNGCSERANRINRLFDVMRRPNAPVPSDAAAAAAITEHTGVQMSSDYLRQLRTGRATNPRLAHLKAIAEFFGVSPTYLLDEKADPKIESQLELLREMRDAGIRNLAKRTVGPTPGGIESRLRMADHARKLERLSPVAPRGDGEL